MKMSMIVIDDFYDDPYEVREAALGFPYQEREEFTNWPGVNSLQQFMVERLDNFVSDIVHEPMMGTPRTAHCGFRLAMEGDDESCRLNMHVDGQAYWSGIVYLTLPEHCQGGTELYRHTELGTDHAPLNNRDVVQYGSRDCASFTKALIERDSNDSSKWEHLMTIPMRFNRCALFRSWYWHTSGPSFGDRPENARLIQMFFFSLDTSKLST